MKTNRIVLGLLLLAGASAVGLVAWRVFQSGGLSAPTQINDKGVIKTTSDDVEMNEARAAAQSTVGEFIKALSSPCVECRNFTVKKRYPTSNGDFEHIWIDDVRLESGEFVGTIANDPVSIEGVRYGDTVRASIKDISDWFYTIDGEIVGGCTIKVLWDRATPTERSERFQGVRFRAENDPLQR